MDFNSLYVYLKRSVRNIYLRIIYENILLRDVIYYEHCKQKKKKILLSTNLFHNKKKVCLHVMQIINDNN